jgi:signal transduction histidine kinase
VLGKVLAALVLVLIVSSAVTAFVDARLTHNAVADETRQVAGSNLRVLQEAFSERQRNLVVNLRALADRILADGLGDPARRPELIARLGSDATSLQLDQLDVLDATGAALDPPVSVGRLTPVLPLTGTQPFTSEPTSHLVAARQGAFVQSVPVPIGSDEHPLVLLGGLQFGDDLAYQLRRQVGGLASVILVAGTKLAGSSLDTPVANPPGFSADAVSSRLRFVRVGGIASVVAYVPVGRSAQDRVGGALGIALPDPAAPLDRALADRRAATGVLLTVLAIVLGWAVFRVLTKRLVRLAATAERIAAGDLDRPFVAEGGDEIARLAGALEHMREELRGELAVVEHLAEQLRATSQRIVAAQDEERRRLARDLHDGIQQQLVVLRMRVGLGDGVSPPAASDVGAELDATIERLREVSHGLYPAILRDRGLTAAVHSYAGRLPVASTVAVSPDPLPRLAPEVESAAYFLLCEAGTNALKHAGATEVDMSLAVADGQLVVRVGDDGRGFDTTVRAEPRRRAGLLNMEDRVRAFGGTLRIESTPGGGTSVEATFPLEDAPSPAEPAPAPGPAPAPPYPV